jgi:poly(3-hydroxybutyrate) depolymerase
MLLDPRRLATEVGSEVRSIKAGQNPYRDRRGDTWRVLKTEDGEIPLRLYLSRSPDKNKLLPVVIALHGAGGDENMFPEAYGAGLIKKLAEKHGFLLVSPLADDFSGARAGQNLEALIGVLKTDYPIDMSRIYVLGHSRGGMLAGSLASIRAERIAAACCICGFQGFGPNVKVIAPTYVIAAELDPLVSFTRIEPAVRKAQEAGLPVEYKLISGYGHTLVVSLVLPEVIPWLLQHRIGK